jgi:hypothetical protein
MQGGGKLGQNDVTQGQVNSTGVPPSQKLKPMFVER